MGNVDRLNYDLVRPEDERERARQTPVACIDDPPHQTYGQMLSSVYNLQLGENGCPVEIDDCRSLETSQIWFRRELVKVTQPQMCYSAIENPKCYKMATLRYGLLANQEVSKFLPPELRNDSNNPPRGHYLACLLEVNESVIRDLAIDRALPLLLHWCTHPDFLDFDSPERMNFFSARLDEDLSVLTWWLRAFRFRTEYLSRSCNE